MASSASTMEHYHPYVNGGLFVLQLAINYNQNAFTPKEEPKPWTWNTLIQPAGIAFLIWLVIYLFTTATVVTDIFFPQFSLFTQAPNGSFLRSCFSASCVFNMGWIILFNWLRWVHVAAIDLASMWTALLPIYLYSTQATIENPALGWTEFVFSHLAIRLYFSWVSAATMLNVSISWQTFHGGYLGFGPYAAILALLLTIVLSGIVYRHDWVIGAVAIWALGWLAKKNGAFPDAAQQVFLKIQAGATIGAMVVALVLAVAAVQRHVQPHTTWTALTSGDLVKPLHAQ